MSNLFIEDFKYAGFGVSRYNLQDYLMNMGAGRTIMRQHYDYCAYGIVGSIIHCIATNNVEFNVKDHEICRLLEQLIRAGGYDKHGVYSQTAHQAMRNLRIMQGKNPDDYKLYNKNIHGTMAKAKDKIKSMFGFGGKQKQEQQKNVHTPQPEPKQEIKAAHKPVQAPAKPANKVAPSVKTQATPTEPKVATKKSDKTTNKNKILYRITTAATVLMALGATVLMTSDINKNAHSNVKTVKAPTFKTITAPTQTHHMVSTYNLTSAWNNQTVQNKSVRPPLLAQSHVRTKPQMVATDSVSVSLTRASKSALDILLGESKANDLCAQVQSQIDAGIFAAPNGMSAQRIAHAMTMSRIYEGKSVILDALNSKTKLTPQQQAEFNHHIEEIGDMGVKLQKRMAAKQQLSTYSKYDRSSKILKQLHKKNMKQLRQARLAHTR